MILKNLGTGDNGKSCFGKKWVKKTCPEIEALGTLDELNSLLGLIRNQKIPKEFRNILLGVQQDIFVVQAFVAGILFGKKYQSLKKEKIVKIETVIKKYSTKVGEIKNFVVPGTNETSAWLDYARAVARRAERRFLLINKIDKNSLVYLNRLSSLLFIMARACAVKKRKKEQNPLY
jgi:cob(I)alamin adenosyltransferase